MMQTAKLAMRRRDVIECRHCGKIAARTGVAQLFCSPRCKHRANREKRATAKILALGSLGSGAATPGLKNNSENKPFQRQKSRGSVPVFLVGPGYRWPGAKLDKQTAQRIIDTELGIRKRRLMKATS
jgi:hypothetical protein